MLMTMPTSPLRACAARALRRARSLPIGVERNNLRQIAIGLRWLERHGSLGAKDRAAEFLLILDTGFATGEGRSNVQR
jgi:hypothetical protein